MAKAVITLKIMPESPEIELEKIKDKILGKIKDFAGDTDNKVEEEPIAFGLKALKIIFVMDEALGSTESLEKIITDIEGVNSVDVVDVRRAVG